MALHQRKGFTAKQSRRTSRRMANSTVGTHVRSPQSRSSSARSSRSSANASSISFSNARKQTRAVRGEVDAIVPNTSSRESSASYNKRMGSRRYVQERQHRQRVRTIVRTVAIVLAVVAIAIGVGYFTYQNLVSGETALRDSDAKSALVAPQKGQAYYLLFSVELGAATETLRNEGPDVLILAQVDEADKSLALISIPANLQVVHDSQTVQLSSVASKGDAALIKAVSNFAGVDIAHYFKLGEGDLKTLVDALGGLDMNLSQEIDDPNAGSLYLPSGSQRINGDGAVVLQRATNVSGGAEGKLANQAAFASTLFARLLSDSATLSFASTISSIGSSFQTDMSSNDLIALGDALKGIGQSDMIVASVPGYESTTGTLNTGEITYFVATPSRWQSLMSAIQSGDSTLGASEIELVDPSSFTVTVLNGASITGAAATTASTLTGNGFKVDKVGNTDLQIYDETLVIYDNANGYAQAQTVINTLHIGRPVYGMGYYEYETDILVILGGDYRPTS